VRSVPDVERYHTRVSSGGGIQPVWSPRGDELFYIEPGPPQGGSLCPVARFGRPANTERSGFERASGVEYPHFRERAGEHL
jgi:hypothetical protein